jgi:hypothetical protein
MENNTNCTCSYVYSEWECLGGSYWVIQEEILRHVLLHSLNKQLEKCFPCKESFVKKSLLKVSEVLSDPIPNYIKNVILKKKIVLLKSEFVNLIDELRRNSKPKVYFNQIFLKTI